MINSLVSWSYEVLGERISLWENPPIELTIRITASTAFQQVVLNLVVDNLPDSRSPRKRPASAYVRVSDGQTFKGFLRLRKTSLTSSYYIQQNLVTDANHVFRRARFSHLEASNPDRNEG